MGNATHCLILHTNMNNIDMRRIGRCVKLPYSHGHVYISQPFLFCKKKYIAMLEKNNYNILVKLELQGLKERRTSQKVIFLYKVVEGLVPAIEPDDYLKKSTTQEIYHC